MAHDTADKQTYSRPLCIDVGCSSELETKTANTGINETYHVTAC